MLTIFLSTVRPRFLSRTGKLKTKTLKLSFGAFKELGSFWAVPSHTSGHLPLSLFLASLPLPSSTFLSSSCLSIMALFSILQRKGYQDLYFSPSLPILKLLLTFQFQYYPTPPKMLSHPIPQNLQCLFKYFIPDFIIFVTLYQCVHFQMNNFQICSLC